MIIIMYYIIINDIMIIINIIIIHNFNCMVLNIFFIQQYMINVIFNNILMIIGLL